MKFNLEKSGYKESIDESVTRSERKTDRSVSRSDRDRSYRNVDSSYRNQSNNGK